MNWESQPLQLHEIETMRGDEEVVERVKRSYRLMLDFYGMRLEDEETGRVGRAEGEQWKERYRNLMCKCFFILFFILF